MNDQVIHTELLVLGAGPGGYSAAFRAADLGVQVVLVERDKKLGGVCLNTGCIPSKALLHAARVIEEAKEMAAYGLVFGDPKIDIGKLLAWKQGIVDKLTNGLSALAKKRNVQILYGEGRFISPTEMSVENADGKTTVNFDNAIIAAGSRPVKLPFL